MDVTSLAAAFAGAKTAQLQIAVAAKMMKMNADAQGSVRSGFWKPRRTTSKHLPRLRRASAAISIFQFEF